jgi:hypothetical protein
MIFINGGFFMSNWKEEYIIQNGIPKCETCNCELSKFSKKNKPYRFCSRRCASDGFSKKNNVKRKHNPLVGATYGQWTVISEKIKVASNRQLYWWVRCSCGKESWRQSYCLVHGKCNACKSCARFQGDKDKFSHSCLRRIRDRALKSGFDYDLTYEYVVALFEQQQNKCALSGVEIKFARKWRDSNKSQSASLDRIDNKKGYVVGNVQWIHKDVNFMKYTFDESYFIQMCLKIVEYRS